MPTAFEDQFFTVDPGNPPPVGTSLTFQRVEFIDEDDDGNIETGTGDTWNGNTISQVWQDDTLTINVPGVGNVTYTGVTFYFSNGDPAVFTPTDGQVLQDGTFVSSTFVTTATETPVTDFGPTCFTPGTLIATPDGTCPVEDLSIGDLVVTMDSGPQPIRFITDDTFPAVGHNTPVLFEAGSIGNEEPLKVSPQHRMLIDGWRAQLFYGESAVLVPAKHLVNGSSIRETPGGEVRYLHVLFDSHQIVFGNGVPSESLYPEQAVALAGLRQHRGLASALLEPQMREATTTMVRPVLGRREAVLLSS